MGTKRGMCSHMQPAHQKGPTGLAHRDRMSLEDDQERRLAEALESGLFYRILVRCSALGFGKLEIRAGGER